MARIDEIQRRVLADSEKTTALWRRFFGEKIHFTWDETRPKDFLGGQQRLSNALTELVNEANVHLNQNVQPNRIGEASLFIRQPHNDRLVLVHSTSTALRESDGTDSRISNWEENYDEVQKILFYSLYDRLATSRNDEWSRKKRGLTGWIAVSGHYLLVNGEQDSVILGLIDKIRPETSPACNLYGLPYWGHRMSEAPSDPKRPKRYLGIPIKSVDSPSTTIGVIRYACPLEGAPLTEIDLAFLEEIGSILSALLHLECTKVRALREAELPHQVERLKRNGNLQNFLSFMSVGLRSQIISTYIDIGPTIGRKEPCVRLVDAVGIAGTVAKHRTKICDYLGQTNPPGFTWWLFKEAPPRPTVSQSVMLENSWSGDNTEIFYQAALSGLGINESTEIRQAIKRYKIKIMGMPILSREGTTIGVLKAEFPTSFDDADYFGTEDLNFFTECAYVVREYLENISEVLTGKYFNSTQPSIGIFFRALAEILRTDLIQKDESDEFWNSLSDYIEKNKEELRIEGMQVFRNVPSQARKELERGVMEVVRKLPIKLINLLEYLLKAGLNDS